MSITKKEAAQKAIDHIQTLKKLSAEEKEKYTKMLEDGADPLEILNQAEDAIQAKIDETFEEAGIKLDENDPEYQAQLKEANDEISAAEKDFNDEMAAIEIKSQRIKDDAAKQIDDIKIKSLRDGIAGE
jgi:hypothetical protein